MVFLLTKMNPVIAHSGGLNESNNLSEFLRIGLSDILIDYPRFICYFMF